VSCALQVRSSVPTLKLARSALLDFTQDRLEINAKNAVSMACLESLAKTVTIVTCVNQVRSPVPTFKLARSALLDFSQLLILDFNAKNAVSMACLNSLAKCLDSLAKTVTIVAFVNQVRSPVPTFKLARSALLDFTLLLLLEINAKNAVSMACLESLAKAVTFVSCVQ